MKLLQEQLMTDSCNVNVLDYVSSFREHLLHACKVAKQARAVSQFKMKQQFDKNAVQRSFQPGDSVLALLPIVLCQVFWALCC